ncbi:MAG: single-stranded-DNA-specific exonuclease RecJ [candidate division WOR-3 bacterium]|nr:single-stranded-DNA-specific exonuclease RecJ [candidate division WOR-3 bacterium]MCX7948049.1 single-stranded-DNA-specific exonuclease RecJ [candidate division WOR-3 bacterium]MDW8151013.1 single-stranded-DNA-specific exonuclease RecJ [candidate division WOR-3 bacterium]
MKNIETIRNEIILEVLRKRGISEEYLDYMLNATVMDLEDPLNIEGIRESVEIIEKHIRNRNKILIHGDYDADGITSLALLYRTLSHIYDESKIIPYIPDRFMEGYGFSEKSIELAKREGVGLIITVDCGITAIEEVKKAIDEGIEVIITDHHEPLDILPKASSIVHPKIGKSHKLVYLTGVGVVYKLVSALYKKFNKSMNLLLWDLDLVAIGTIADMGDLVYENRILTKYGIIVLNKSKKAGIKAIKYISGINGKILPWHISFIIAPRINAAGRMATPDYAFKLLISKDGEEVLRISNLLNKLNLNRQMEQKKIMKGAIKQAIENLDRYVLVLSDWGWHEGVIGIVASKIAEIFYRPVIVISKLGEISKGSCRSIEGFHIQKALSKLSHLLEEFGGHKMAGGFTIKTENIELFKNEIEKIAKNEIKEEQLKRVYDYETEIKAEDINRNFILDYIKLSPFGIGNEHFRFLHKNLKVISVNKSKNNMEILFSNGKLTLKSKISNINEEWLNLKAGDIVDLIFQFSDNFLNKDSLNISALKFIK